MGQAHSNETYQFMNYPPEDIFPQQQPQQQRKVFKAAKKPTAQQTSQKNINITSTPQFTDNKQQSLEEKIKGNNFFSQKNYQKAIECYTQAINLYGTDSIYYSNRAVAYRLLNRYQEAKQDAEQAIKIDQTNARAYFIYGTIILLEVQKSPQISEQLIKQAHRGLQYLDQAYEYIKDNADQQKNKLKVLINQNLGKGKRMVFLIAQEMDRRNIQSLKSILAELAQSRKVKLDWNYLEKQTQKKMLQEIPIPQSFICVISYEIMNEPILFNTGQTYEKNGIFQQFTQNGCTDPITREQIIPQTARLNLQLLLGISELKKKYGWIGIEQEEDYKAIKFE
ncbi:unnamed protein product [Paramecium pentaurelia]|uniref:RING-type E3 ubiquitin transferase n=1 Tax=Paramecium pentaurelia TaxID=43138 RepID=A0A8S1YBX6_9CILI|nr:unnamed protein product [Paramecium pentaurelia]